LIDGDEAVRYLDVDRPERPQGNRRRYEHRDRYPRQRLAAARQQHVDDQDQECSAREHQLRQDVIEIARRQTSRHYRVAPVPPWFAEAAAGSVRGCPSGPHGAAARNCPAADASCSGFGVVLHSAYAFVYSGLTRSTTCCTDVWRRSRNGLGYRPIQTASTMS